MCRLDIADPYVRDMIWFMEFSKRRKKKKRTAKATADTTTAQAH